MANEFIARNGIITLNNTTISGSLTVSSSLILPQISTSSILFNSTSNIVTGSAGLTWNDINGIFNQSATTPELRITTIVDGTYANIKRTTVSNQLSLSNNVVSVAGVGSAVGFTGDGAYFTASGSGLPSGASAFSISMWIYYYPGINANMCLLTWGSGTSVSSGSLTLVGRSGGGTAIRLYCGTTAISNSVGISGGWHHVVITYDSTNVKIYVDNGSASTYNAGTIGINLSSSTLSNNAANSGYAAQSAQAYYNQILIYNGVTLTSTQVSTLYASGNGIYSLPSDLLTGLVRYYPTNVSNGSSLTELVSNYTGTITGTVTYPNIGFGKITTPSSTAQSNYIISTDGVYASETGTLYLGDTYTGNYIQGISTKFKINNTYYPLIVGTNSKLYVNSTNTSNLSTLLSLSDLGVVGGVSIGTYVTSVAAPTNGLAVSGTTLIGSSTDDTINKLQVSGSVKIAGNSTLSGSLNIVAPNSNFASSSVVVTNSAGYNLFQIYNGGNIIIGGNQTSSLFQISQPTSSLGTIAIVSGSTSITGSSTQFTNTFKVGDTFTATGSTYTISSIASDVGMVISPTPSGSYPTATYTLTGGTRFSTYGNGNVAWGNPGVGGTSATMWYDARYAALNIGTSTQQSTYLLNVNGASNFSSVRTSGLITSLGGLTVTGSFNISGSSILKGQVTFGGPTPVVVSGSGAGTTSTVTIAGTNNGGVITAVTGLTPGTSATVATVTYTAAFPAGSSAVLYPANANTAILSGTSMVYTSGSTTNFTITSGTVSLVGSTTYVWNYKVTGY